MPGRWDVLFQPVVNTPVVEEIRTSWATNIIRGSIRKARAKATFGERYLFFLCLFEHQLTERPPREAVLQKP